jgi:hypothetical protein
MADKKISELDNYPSALATDLIPIVQVASNVTKKIRLSALLSGNIPSKATSAQIRTGTDDVKFATAKSLKDAGVVKISAATSAIAGKIETATAAETSTGTDAGIAVTPDGLAGSTIFGARAIAIQVIDGETAITSGDGKAYVRVPPQLNGMNIVDVAANVVVKSTTGKPTIQLARGRQANATSDFTYADVLSSSRKITIDVSEYDSKDAVSAVIINTANDDLATGDLLRVDVDIAGNPAKGLNLNIVCQLP